MDFLATEIVTHILSFSKRNEIHRWKMLNSNMRMIIERNQQIRNNFPIPMFGMIIETFQRGPRKTINIHFEGKCNISIDYSQSQEVKITAKSKPPCNCIRGLSDGCFYFHGHSTSFCTQFFNRFFKNTDHSLLAMFNYIFEKIDVDELILDGIHDKLCFSILSQAIRGSRIQIREVGFSLLPLKKNDIVVGQIPELCELLTAIGNQKRKGAEFPRMVFMGSATLAKEWPLFVELNGIAGLYRRSLYALQTPLADELIITIVKGWLSNPIGEFNFGLFFPLHNDEPTSLEISNPKFEITMINGDRFLCHSLEEEEASLKISDPVSGNSFVFQKKNGFMRRYDYGRWLMKAVHVSIEVCLK